MQIFFVQDTNGKILHVSFDRTEAESFAQTYTEDKQIRVNVHEHSVVGSFKVPTMKGDLVVTETDPESPGVRIGLVPRGKDVSERIPIVTVMSDPVLGGNIRHFFHGGSDDQDAVVHVLPDHSIVPRMSYGQSKT